MAQPDLEPIGRLERVVQPTLDRFTLNAELGVNTVLSPDAAKATAQAFEVLTRTIDLMEAQRFVLRQIAFNSVLIVCAVAALVATVWL